MIDLQDAIQILERGDWVSIAYVGADKKAKKYGHIIRIPRCRISRQVTSSNTTASHITTGSEMVRTRKMAHHSEHFTRNVITPSGAIRKIHLRLLFSINNQRIV